MGKKGGIDFPERHVAALLMLTDNLHNHEEDAEHARNDQLAPRFLVDATFPPDRMTVQVWKDIGDYIEVDSIDGITHCRRQKQTPTV